MNDGEISPKTKTYQRDNMLGYAKVNEGQSEKKNDDPLI